MSELETTLEQITDLVGLYESGAFVKREDLMSMQRKLSALNYRLTVIHTEYRKQHNGIIFNRPDGSSVASAKNKADVDVPEVDITRKIMNAVEKVLISMSIELKQMLND